MSDEQRVFLIKPGDTLVFGNVGDLDPESVDALSQVLYEQMGLRVLCFAADIDMAAVPGHGDT